MVVQDPASQMEAVMNFAFNTPAATQPHDDERPQQQQEIEQPEQPEQAATPQEPSPAREASPVCIVYVEQWSDTS